MKIRTNSGMELVAAAIDSLVNETHTPIACSEDVSPSRKRKRGKLTLPWTFAAVHICKLIQRFPTGITRTILNSGVNYRMKDAQT